MHNRKVLLVPFGAVAVFLTLTAAAYACTAFNGSFTVVGGGTGGSGSVTANGTDAQGVPGMTQTVSGATGALKGKTGSTVTVSTGTATNGTKLPANTYSINYYNSGPLGPGYEDHATWTTDCMTGGPGVALGTVTVGTAGTITSTSTTFTLPLSSADTGTEESAVCISDATGAYGNQAPIQII